MIALQISQVEANNKAKKVCERKVFEGCKAKLGIGLV